LGDIVISTETAQRQAIQGKHSLLQELAWLATHGLLHLLGWDHPDEASLVEMLQQQTVLMNVIEVPVPSWETLGIQGAVV
jgi:probable rRNA maturation factor